MKEDHRMMNLNELRSQMIVDNTHKRDSLDHKCTSKRAVDSNTALQFHVLGSASNICVTSRMED
jgi:hypothetical protein